MPDYYREIDEELTPIGDVPEECLEHGNPARTRRPATGGCYPGGAGRIRRTLGELTATYSACVG